MMNSTNLQTADYLDILFDGRNKDYGAYQLQRNYNKRLSTAVGIVLLLCLVVVVSGMLANNGKQAVSGPVIQDSVVLTQVDQSPCTACRTNTIYCSGYCAKHGCN
jgi:periplasmic protein TonB